MGISYLNDQNCSELHAHLTENCFLRGLQIPVIRLHNGLRGFDLCRYFEWNRYPRLGHITIIWPTPSRLAGPLSFWSGHFCTLTYGKGSGWDPPGLLPLWAAAQQLSFGKKQAAFLTFATLPQDRLVQNWLKIIAVWAWNWIAETNNFHLAREREGAKEKG